MRSIDSFLHSWGWQLGKHSAVYNSAYVHCSWGLWVSQKGCSLCLCPKRQQESQLYGNGCQGGGGASLTDASTRVTQPRCLRSEKHVCPPILLTQTQRGHFAVTHESRFGATWFSLPFVLLAPSPAGPQAWPVSLPSPSRNCSAECPECSSCHGPLMRNVGQSRLLLFGRAQEGTLRSRMEMAIACCVPSR